MESRLVKTIPHHEISSYEENLTLDQLNTHLSQRNQVKMEADLHLKLSGPSQTRTPIKLEEGRRVSLALIANERATHSATSSVEGQAAHYDPLFGGPDDPDAEHRSRVVVEATFTIDTEIDLDVFDTVSEVEMRIQQFVAGFITEIKDRGSKRVIWKKGSEHSIDERLNDLGMTPNTKVIISLAVTDSFIECKKKMEQMEKERDYLDGKLEMILPFYITSGAVTKESEMTTSTTSGEQMETSERESLEGASKAKVAKLEAENKELKSQVRGKPASGFPTTSMASKPYEQQMEEEDRSAKLSEEVIKLKEKVATLEEQIRKAEGISSYSIMESLKGATGGGPSDLPTTSSGEFDLFFSYDLDSRPIVKAMYDNLRNEGFRCWMEMENLAGGGNLYSKIIDGIMGSKCVVACITKRYLQSKSCNHEIMYAFQQKDKIIIPLLLEETGPPGESEMRLVLSKLESWDMSESNQQLMEWRGDKVKELSAYLRHRIKSAY